MTARVRPHERPIVPLGEMRDRVTISRVTTVADAGGGQAETWATLYANIPAKVQPVRGHEQETQGRVQTVRTILVTVQYGYDITILDKLVWDGVDWNITHAENRDGSRRRLTLECEVGRGAP